ncbi:hypothetical protein M413DRAFT_30470 [Hebeloma cylindrosporum]|uniref:DUF6533 domain-containing protein n=1 Tax=Hebeloma cylindrosporum TaxID=76867 RepID=A0A0C3C390_HEBCY|nr:hypothetical protein M413DRAFT_30470 [Hebeloma cylindrosporum h7]
MSSDVTLDELWSMNVDYYFNLVSLSILLYDYFLTFVAEVESCWIAQLSWGLGFFYMNRYLVVFGHVPIMLEFFWSTSYHNKSEERATRSNSIAIQVVVACMLIMRMYALYERSGKVLALYIVVAGAILAVACWAMLGGKKEKPRDVDLQSHIGCASNLSRDKAVRFGTAWAGMLVFDSLVFCMTLYKAVVLPRPNGVNILDILLRDGAIYFAVMVASNLANVLTFMLGGVISFVSPSRWKRRLMLTCSLSQEVQ